MKRKNICGLKQTSVINMFCDTLLKSKRWRHYHHYWNITEVYGNVMSAEMCRCHRQFSNNGVFKGVYSCWCVTCEDAGQAAYSQFTFTRKVSVVKLLSNYRTCCSPSSLHTASLTCTQVILTKIAFFKH